MGQKMLYMTIGLLTLTIISVSSFTTSLIAGQNAFIHTTSIGHQIQNAVRLPWRNECTRLYLANKLWDRLGIEEDPEPFWYLINCVAGSELDLLRQCRTVCEDMPDAIKFVVPLEKKTRSHGAKKMITETKVKYQGYVFAKLRLCPEVYEAIQSLDLCRSWMGTVNHKGYKKLPPVPVALNELEIEKFGLEDEEEDEFDDEFVEEEEEGGIIVDSEDDDDEEYVDPMYRGVDKEALKQFKGLKVEDMVKVTAKGKFFNEDGVIRRLKNGMILVRFYTYGTMFEEWMEPDDVRKLSAEEILRGLSGPSKPITQEEFDGPSVSSYGGRYGGNERRGDLRQSLMGTMRDGRGGGGGFQQRNRRQDRTADRYRGGAGNTYQDRREEENWNWYKDQQRPKRTYNDYQDGDMRIRPGSSNTRSNNRRSYGRNDDDDDDAWVQGDVDSQWGRRGRSDNNNNNNRRQQFGNRRGTMNNQYQNRQTEAAIEGKDDWSAFVSNGNDNDDSIKDDGDDFFSSLMNDLNKDLDNTKSSISNIERKMNKDKSGDDDFFESLMADLKEEEETAQQGQRRTRSESVDRNNEVSKTTTDDTGDDDFFASLMAELGEEVPSTTQTKQSSAKITSRPETRTTPSTSEPSTKQKSAETKTTDSSSSNDDFFMSLMAELEDELSEKEGETSTSTSTLSDSSTSSLDKPKKKDEKLNDKSSSSDDDIFASLMAELGEDVTEISTKPKKTVSDLTKDDNSETSLETEHGPTSANIDTIDNSNDNDIAINRQNGSGKDTRSKNTATPPADALHKKTVPELKDMLRDRGLKVSGKKAELIDRLVSSS